MKRSVEAAGSTIVRCVAVEPVGRAVRNSDSVSWS